MKGNIFIKRPVMAISISVLILVIGLISLFKMCIRDRVLLRHKPRLGGTHQVNQQYEDRKSVV